MPVKNIIKAWSYSRYSLWKLCPRKFKYKVIDKMPVEDTYAASRGQLIHAKAEQFVKGNIRGMPKELTPFKDELKQLKHLCAETEVDMSVDRGWNPSHTKDWDNVWCRAFSDVNVLIEEELSIIDHKTGKIYDSHEEQGDLYATCGFCHYPDAQIIQVEFWYFDQQDLRSWEYRREDLDKMIKKWENKAKPMFRDRKFECKPGGHCNWCDFNSYKGGPCEY